MAVAEHLAARGAGVSPTDGDGNRPLHLAALEGHVPASGIAAVRVEARRLRAAAELSAARLRAARIEEGRVSG